MPQPPDPPWGDILPATDFRLDMNYDGLFTISDVNMSFWLGWEWLVWLFFLPGNTMIWTLLKYVPILGVFLELKTDFYNGWITGIVSGFTWLIIWGLSIIWELKKGEYSVSLSGCHPYPLHLGCSQSPE